MEVEKERAKVAEEREQKLKEAIELIETMSEVTEDWNVLKFTRHVLSTLYPLDKEGDKKKDPQP